MFAAHMDEIGLMVKYIDDKGFCTFHTGGWYDQTLFNQRIIIPRITGPVYGVLGSENHCM